jgi:hypothetical protein
MLHHRRRRNRNDKKKSHTVRGIYLLSPKSRLETPPATQQHLPLQSRHSIGVLITLQSTVMGNNPSQAIATAGAKAQLTSAMQDVGKQLGISDDGKKQEAEANAQKAIGCANKKEQKQRHIDRQKEYEMKQKERTERKEALESKWAKGSATGAGTGEGTSEYDAEKDKEMSAKIAEMKQQYKGSIKDKKTKKSGFFGSK